VAYERHCCPSPFVSACSDPFHHRHVISRLNVGVASHRHGDGDIDRFGRSQLLSVTANYSCNDRRLARMFTSSGRGGARPTTDDDAYTPLDRSSSSSSSGPSTAKRNGHQSERKLVETDRDRRPASHPIPGYLMSFNFVDACTPLHMANTQQSSLS
jgi:hypothetical protein